MVPRLLHHWWISGLYRHYRQRGICHNLILSNLYILWVILVGNLNADSVRHAYGQRSEWWLIDWRLLGEVNVLRDDNREVLPDLFLLKFLNLPLRWVLCRLLLKIWHSEWLFIFFRNASIVPELCLLGLNHFDFQLFFLVAIALVRAEYHTRGKSCVLAAMAFVARGGVQVIGHSGNWGHWFHTQFVVLQREPFQDEWLCYFSYLRVAFADVKALLPGFVDLLHSEAVGWTGQFVMQHWD